MRFKRIFSALCIAFLVVLQCLPVYAANIYIESNKHYVDCFNGEEFWFSGYQRTPSKAEVPIYLMETENSLWLVSDCGHSDWYVRAFGNGKTYQSYFTHPAVSLGGAWYGQEIPKGSAWGPFTNWGIVELYNMSIARVNAGSNSQFLYYTEETLGSDGADFFHYTPIVYRTILAEVPAVLPGMNKTALVLTACGVCLMASLLGLVIFGKVFKIFQI